MEPTPKPKPSAYSPESRIALLDRLRIEDRAAPFGSPSDKEIGQEQLVVMALGHIPALLAELEAAEARMADLQTELECARLELAGVQNVADFNRVARKKRELEAQMHFDRAEAAEAQMAGLRKQLGPLPFPASQPAASFEQYFCQAGDDVCLLLWLTPLDALEYCDVKTETGVWSEWDGDEYQQTGRAVTAFWPHPQVQKGGANG